MHIVCSVDILCQVVEALLKFIAEDVLSSCQADVHYVQKRAEEETGQSVQTFQNYSLHLDFIFTI